MWLAGSGQLFEGVEGYRDLPSSSPYVEVRAAVRAAFAVNPQLDGVVSAWTFTHYGHRPLIGPTRGTEVVQWLHIYKADAKSLHIIW
jgi:hypothetical protein